MTTATRTDKHGFPRCLGTGHYSYNQKDGDRCYGCGGTGWTHTPKAAEQFVAWQDAVKAVARVLAQNLQTGTEVRGWDSRGEWELVETLEVTDEPSGWKNLPNGEREIQSFMTIVNGRKVNGGTIFRVKGAAATVPAAPFVEASR